MARQRFVAGVRLTHTLIDAWMHSHPKAPRSVTLDIGDTRDIVHLHQQLSLFNAHDGERCFPPIHVYDTDPRLRHRPRPPRRRHLAPGKTPPGVEARGHPRRLVRRVRALWPTTRIL